MWRLQSSFFWLLRDKRQIDGLHPLPLHFLWLFCRQFPVESLSNHRKHCWNTGFRDRWFDRIGHIPNCRWWIRRPKCTCFRCQSWGSFSPLNSCDRYWFHCENLGLNVLLEENLSSYTLFSKGKPNNRTLFRYDRRKLSLRSVRNTPCSIRKGISCDSVQDICSVTVQAICSGTRSRPLFQCWSRPFSDADQCYGTVKDFCSGIREDLSCNIARATSCSIHKDLLQRYYRAISSAVPQECFLSGTTRMFPQRYQMDVFSDAIQDILLIFQTMIQVIQLKNRFRYFCDF